MTRLTLLWDLRSLADVDNLSRHALAADDPVAFLNAARMDAWRSPEDRDRAADYLTRHLWPADSGVQQSTWITDYVLTIPELEALKEQGLYERPTDGRGNALDGYHSGGIWHTSPARAKPLACPPCGYEGEFWDWTDVDSGDAGEPEHVCPQCGWKPPESGRASE